MKYFTITLDLLNITFEYLVTGRPTLKLLIMIVIVNINNKKKHRKQRFYER